MNRIKFGVSLVALLAITSLASCNNNDSSSSSSGGSSQSGAGDVVLTGVDSKHEFVLFNQNKNKDDKEDGGFYDHSQSYKVGDDNAFNVKPELTVLNAQTLVPVDSSNWDHDFVISATLDGQAAGEQYFSVLDARKCDVKFTSEAVGKTFTISVAPGGVSESEAASFKKSITVEVVDGYNVYNAKELSYFDTRGQGDTTDATTVNDVTRVCKWYEFKTANGLDPAYRPASLIFQTNIKVTKDDMPSNMFYTKAEVGSDTKAEGSLIDWTYIYLYTESGSLTVDGNYFSLDMSEIPLVKRESDRVTPVGGVVSHAAAFRFDSGEDVKFQNINMSGNAKNAADDNDKIYGGGFIFCKGAGSKRFLATNLIATKFFITFMGDDPHEGAEYTEFRLDKIKCFNNYNSFLYNWGSLITVSNSLFKSCGGPVVIQDHIQTDDYEAANGMVLFGHTSTTNFVDCVFDNFVVGQEAWFQQFDATAVSNDIKMMSDLLAVTGLPKSFVTNDKHEGKTFQALAAAEQKSFFNFIAFNKSGRSQGLTAVPSAGTVNISNSSKSISFDYRQPIHDDLAIAYAAYLTASSEELEAATQAFFGLALQKGVITQADLVDEKALEAKLEAYFTPICLEHVVLRNLNNNGGPAFDLGPNFDLLGYMKATDGFQSATNIALVSNGVAQPETYTPSADQLKAMPDYGALYYNGMMLVFGLYDYVA